MPILAVAGVFDALRAFFSLFWFFGPIVVGAGTAAATEGWIGSWGSTLLGTGTGAAVGYFGGPAFTVFGVVMAMVIGFLGWMVVGFLLLLFNARIFKENVQGGLWSLFGLGLSEVPFLSALPALTGTTAKLYRTQIKKEKARFVEWQAAEQFRIAREREEQFAILAQAGQAVY